MKAIKNPVMNTARRTFLKSSAAVSGALVIGIALPGRFSEERKYSNTVGCSGGVTEKLFSVS